MEYDSSKISTAIEKANRDVTESERATEEQINKIIKYVESLNKKRILVEDIQDIIENKLMELKKYSLAKEYIVYRYTRTLVRKQNTTDETILGLIKNTGEVNSFSEKDEKLVTISEQRNLIAGEVSKDLTKRILLPQKIINYIENGSMYFHNMDYFLQPMIDWSIVNIEDILKNGTSINNVKIEAPQDFVTACIIMADVMLSVASNQYGMQYIDLNCLGKYLANSDDTTNEKLEIGVKILKYQINTLACIYGTKPLVTLTYSLDSVKEDYKWIKLIVDELSKCENVVLKERKDISICKAGMFNQGTVTVNLSNIAKASEKCEENFWNNLEVALEMCYEALMCRHYGLLGTTSNVSPILWQNGAIARLGASEKIDKFLKEDFSVITLGYFGERDVINILKDNDADDKDVQIFNERLLRYLDQTVQKWRKMTGLGFVCKRSV